MAAIVVVIEIICSSMARIYGLHQEAYNVLPGHKKPARRYKNAT